jgi:hypothetical protein
VAAVEWLGGGDLLSVFAQEGWLREERTKGDPTYPCGHGSGWERVGHDLPAMAASFSREVGEHRNNHAELGDDNVGPTRQCNR